MTSKPHWPIRKQVRIWIAQLPENVVRIGMLPRACLSKIRPLGNAALAGASMLALDGENWRKLAQIPEKCRYLELSGRDDFSRAFTDSLTF